MKVPVSGGWACLTHRPVLPASVMWRSGKPVITNQHYCKAPYLTARAAAAARKDAA